MIRRMLLGAVILVGVLLACGGGVALWWSANFSPDREPVYREVDGMPLAVEIFLPHPEASGAADAREAGRPAILFFFGGGWMAGSTLQFHPWARMLADRGWVAATADYRVYSRHGTTAFAAVDDAEQAYRWLRSHAGELGVDPARIVLAGGSAGGHLAAVSGIIATARDPELPPPAALVLLNPVTDTNVDGDDHYLHRVARLFEGRGREISPAHHVRPGLPPTLVLHGTGDDMVPFETSEAFCRRMREAANDCELRAYEGAPHGFFNYGFGRFDEVQPEVVAFLERVVGPAGS